MIWEQVAAFFGGGIIGVIVALVVIRIYERIVWGPRRK